MSKALFYEQKDDKIKCLLCPHGCSIPEGARGRCRVRANVNGELQAENYGIVTSIALDPIEKKPLYHFKPGSNILSVGSYGCNFTCSFCQNYSIAHHQAPGQYTEPDKLIDICNNAKNNTDIAFTYNEPSIWYEYVYDVSKKIKETNPRLKVVLVTNGYMSVAALTELLPYIDAMNIDLKAFDKDYYKKICGGRVEDVLSIIEASHDKCHIEITTLVVNGHNDSREEIEEISSYLASLDKNIPLHLSRYYPTYKMDAAATPVEKMRQCHEYASKFLNYVYIGNVQGTDNSTYCPKCRKILIERRGLSSRINIHNNTCPQCGYQIKIIL